MNSSHTFRDYRLHLPEWPERFSFFSLFRSERDYRRAGTLRTAEYMQLVRRAVSTTRASNKLRRRRRRSVTAHHLADLL